jgi:Domain of unknown function (DUF1902).
MVENLMTEIAIQAEWDAHPSAWLASSEKVPGLIAQPASYKELVDIVEDLLPGFVSSASQTSVSTIPYQLVSHHVATLPAS